MATKKAAVRKSKSFSLSFATAGAATTTLQPAAPYQENFRVRRAAPDKYSQPTTIALLQYFEEYREIRVVGADGNIRKCKIDRLPSIEDARDLLRRLKVAGAEKKAVVFIAAGDYSPNAWFYNIK